MCSAVKGEAAGLHAALQAPLGLPLVVRLEQRLEVDPCVEVCGALQASAAEFRVEGAQDVGVAPGDHRKRRPASDTSRKVGFEPLLVELDGLREEHARVHLLLGDRGELLAELGEDGILLWPTVHLKFRNDGRRKARFHEHRGKFNNLKRLQPLSVITCPLEVKHDKVVVRSGGKVESFASPPWSPHVFRCRILQKRPTTPSLLLLGHKTFGPMV
mmetsp:Transcript_4785/g.11520  ORF Transcript_4785/g.11520 Transcript_4785/m.11520 type:complete len:215 (-) Transcript_4785:443-1087(-)